MIALQVLLARGSMPYLSHGEGPMLLFLHGGSVTPRVYIPLLELLGKTYTVVAPTHPGHGDSFPLSSDWTMDHFITTYKEFLTAIQRKPAVVVGHSFGGALALLLAAHRVGSKTVAMDAVGLPFMLSAGAYFEAKKREAQDLLAYANDTDTVKKTLSAAGVLFHTAIERFEDISWLAKRVPMMDITGEVSRIRRPVSLLWGEDDGIVPVSVGKGLHAVIPGSTLTIFPHRGHTYPVTDPQFTYREIIKALHRTS